MDRDLVIRAQQRDHLAFESLMVASHGRLFRLAHGILRDPHLAEDATQQAFLDIWREIHRLRDPARYEAWSYRVTVRVCYAEAKRRPRWTASTLMPATEGPQARDPFETVVERDQLERAFARLSMDHRVAIVMRFLLDMSPEQMAEILDIPRRTVYSRLKRAIPAMRAALEADARPVDPKVHWQEALR
jgi:RNA polymerase sigma-70 factor, ECF subfamily